MANHIHVHLRTKDAGTSEGARKAAMHRKAHGYHKQQALAGKEGHGAAAALHQHAAMMHASPNPMYRGPKAEAASAKAIEASRKLGHTVDAGTSEGARKAAQTRKSRGGVIKPNRNDRHNPDVPLRHTLHADPKTGMISMTLEPHTVTRKQSGAAKTARRSFYPASKTSAAPRGMAVSKRQSPSQKHYPFNPRKD